MVTLSLTFIYVWSRYQGHDIFEVQCGKKRRVLKTKLLLHNRKLYVIMEWGCLVTLSDL